MKAKPVRSLQTRVLQLVLLASVPVLLLIGVFSAQNLQRARQDARKDAERLARLLAVDHQEMIEGARQVLTALTHVPAIRDADPAGATPVLQQLLSQYPQFQNLRLTAPTGEMLASALPLPHPVNVSDRPWFQEILRVRQFRVGHFIVGRISGRPTIILALPILNEHEEVRAVVSAELDLRRLGEKIAALPQPRDAVLTLLDYNGRILVRSRDPEKWAGQRLADAKLSDAIMRQQTGFIEGPDVEGVPQLTAFERVSEAAGAWSVVVSIPRAAAYATAYSVLRREVVLLLVVALLALGLSFWVIRRDILRPVAELTRAARGLAGGDLSVRANVRTGLREITEVGTTFNDMAAALQRTNRMLRTISLCNQELVRATHETELLQRICDVMVENGGYRLAWIGFAEHDDACTVRPVARAGHDDGYLAAAGIVWSDTERGRGPTGTAIRTGQIAVAHDLATAPNYAPWREEALRRGYRAAIALPLTVAGQPVGAFHLYTAEPSAFDEAEVNLLKELADDISYGIAALRARDERDRAQALLDNLLTTMPDHIYFKDRQGRFLRINKAMARSFGLRDPAEAVGKTDADFFTAEHARQAYEDEQRVMATGIAMVSQEEKETWPDGRVTWVSTTKVPLYDRDGRVVGLMGISRDITAHKQAEEALWESEARFRRLLENSLVGIYRTTPDGRILLANPTLVKMLRYPSFEAMAQLNLEKDGFYPQYPRRLFKEAIERDGVIRGLESALICADGTTVYVRESAQAVRGPDGRIEYYDGVMEDITEQRRLEESLRQSQKMEAIGRLAGGVAHDFNNLLSVIIGYSNLLQPALPADPKLQTYAKEIEKDGHRAAQLTRQLLAFSRKQILQPQVLDLNAVLTDLQKMLSRLIGEDIELTTGLASDLHRVKADPGQLEQVIINLCVNARDAMPKGGKLRIETRNVPSAELEALREEPGTATREPATFVQLAITDTGIGMTPEVRAHLFEPFFTTKEPGKGTGLGLATVFGIVKQSGGFITVETEPGRGTTFRIYLPGCTEAVNQQATEAGDRALLGGTETILVVEDEPTLRELATVILSAAGYQVLTAANGVEGLAVAAQHTGAAIALLVTDVVMPQMGGRDLADRLQARHPRLRVLFTSGYTANAIVHHGVLEHGIRFLQKPYTSSELLRKVREALDQ